MPPSRRGTGYTNLQTYLGLNQGAAGQMGGAIAGDVERVGAGVRGDIDTVESATLKDIKDKTLNMPGTGPITSQQATDLGQRTYDGPLGIDAGTLTSLYGRAAQAQNQATALGTNTGRATLLQQKYGPTSWGGGQLDAALAGAGSAGGRIANAAGSYGRLLQHLGGAQSRVQTAGREAETTTKNAVTAYRDMAPHLQQMETQQARTRPRGPVAPPPLGGAAAHIDRRRKNPDDEPFNYDYP